MSTVIDPPKTLRQRLLRFTITSTLMGVSFALGATIAAIVAIRLLFPIAVTGMMFGLAGMASASANATTSALYSGDSEIRLTVLTQLKQSFESQPTQAIDPQLAEWILPAIEQCRTDSDPAVVKIAEELSAYVKINASHPPQNGQNKTLHRK